MRNARHPGRAIAAALLAAATSVALAPSAGAAPVPARATTFYVSTHGNDSNSGASFGQAFRTLPRAQRAVRSAIAHGMDGNVTVRIGGGTYYQSQPLSFDNRDSGRDGHRITWTAMPGRTPHIVGGLPVRDWQPYRDGIYEAPLPSLPGGGTPTVDTLVENGQRATMARYPDTGYLKATGSSASTPQTQFTYADGSLPSGDLSGAQVNIWADADWFDNIVPVASIDRSADRITLTGPTVQPIKAGNRFFLQGPLALLNQPGEFSVDRSTGTLYYKPRSLPISKDNIVVPTVDDVVDIHGSDPAHPVTGLTSFPPRGQCLGLHRLLRGDPEPGRRPRFRQDRPDYRQDQPRDDLEPPRRPQPARSVPPSERRPHHPRARRPLARGLLRRQPQLPRAARRDR